MAKRNFSKRLRRVGDVLGQVMLMYLQRQQQQEQLEQARQNELVKQERAFQNNIRLAELSARLADERQQRLFTHQQELAKARAVEKAKTIQERKKNKEDADKFQAFVNKNKLYSARIASLSQAIKSLETIPGEEAAGQRNRYAKEMNALFKGQGELYEKFGMVAPILPDTSVSTADDVLTPEDLLEIEEEKFGKIDSALLYFPDRPMEVNSASGVFREGESPEKFESIIKMLQSAQAKSSQKTAKQLNRVAKRIKELQISLPGTLSSRDF